MFKKINISRGESFNFQTHINEFLIKREEANFTETFMVDIPCKMSTHNHVHDNIEQTFFVLSGKGLIEYADVDNEGNAETIKKNDVIYIPVNTEHKIINTGDEMLVYLCVNSFVKEKDMQESTSLGHAESVMKDYELEKNISLKIEKKPVLVVGASGFIGQRLVLELLENGIPVWAMDENRFPKENIYGDLTEILDDVKVNIENEQEVNEALNLLVKKHKNTPKSLICLLGDSSIKKHTLNMNSALFRTQVENNLVNPYIIANEYAKILYNSNESGSILFAGSIGANKSHREQVAYDASKGGIESLTRALALDLATYKINVNTIEIGPIEGSESSNDDKEMSKSLRELVPMQRYARVDEIIDLIMAFIFNIPQFVTGQTIAIDGGLTIQLRPIYIERLNDANMYLK